MRRLTRPTRSCAETIVFDRTLLTPKTNTPSRSFFEWILTVAADASAAETPRRRAPSASTSASGRQDSFRMWVPPGGSGPSPESSATPREAFVHPRGWTDVLLGPEPGPRRLERGTYSRAVQERSEAAWTAERAQRHAHSSLVGPAQLVVVGASEEVVVPEPVLDRLPQHLAAQHEAGRQAPPLLVEARLQQELAAGEHDRVVRGDRASVELKEMQAEPAALGGDPREAPVEALRARVAQDGRALLGLPAGRLHPEDGVKIVVAAGGAEDQLALALERPAPAAQLRAEVAALASQELVIGRGELQERARGPSLGHDAIAGRPQDLARHPLGRRLVHRREREHRRSHARDDLPDGIARLLVGGQGVPVAAVVVCRGQEARAAPAEECAGSQPAVADGDDLRPAFAERLPPRREPLNSEERRALRRGEGVPLRCRGAHLFQGAEASIADPANRGLQRLPLPARGRRGVRRAGVRPVPGRAGRAARARDARGPARPRARALPISAARRRRIRAPSPLPHAGAPARRRARLRVGHAALLEGA